MVYNYIFEKKVRSIFLLYEAIFWGAYGFKNIVPYSATYAAVLVLKAKNVKTRGVEIRLSCAAARVRARKLHLSRPPPPQTPIANENCTKYRYVPKTESFLSQAYSGRRFSKKLAYWIRILSENFMNNDHRCRTTNNYVSNDNTITFQITDISRIILIRAIY